MADERYFEPGTRVELLINWRTFQDHGFPYRLDDFMPLIHNACAAWNNRAGTNLRFSVWNSTVNIDSIWDISDGQCIVKMDEAVTSQAGWLASGGGIPGRGTITFYRYNWDLTPWNWVLKQADPGTEVDFQGVFIHELGHVAGLEHSTDAADVMVDGYRGSNRYGPFENDVDRLRQLYDPWKENRLKVTHTYNSESWFTRENSLTKHGPPATPWPLGARTNQGLGVVDHPDAPLYLLAWNDPEFRQHYISGDGSDYLFRRGWWKRYPTSRESVFGPEVRRDDASTMLWAWVDPGLNLHIDRSTTAGLNWSSAGAPAGAKTFGRPALCWTTVGGTPTWILFWAHYDRSINNDPGRIMSSVSTNDGTTWSAPAQLDPDIYVQGGLTAAAAVEDNILVAFPWAGSSDDVNDIVVVKCIMSGGRPAFDSFSYSGLKFYQSGQPPALVYHPISNRFTLAWRDSRGHELETGAIKVRRKVGSGSWSLVKTLSSESAVGPVMTYSLGFGETALWYAEEGL